MPQVKAPVNTALDPPRSQEIMAEKQKSLIDEKTRFVFKMALATVTGALLGAGVGFLVGGPVGMTFGFFIGAGFGYCAGVIIICKLDDAQEEREQQTRREQEYFARFQSFPSAGSNNQ